MFHKSKMHKNVGCLFMVIIFIYLLYVQLFVESVEFICTKITFSFKHTAHVRNFCIYLWISETFPMQMCLYQSMNAFPFHFIWISQSGNEKTSCSRPLYSNQSEQKCSQQKCSQLRLQKLCRPYRLDVVELI